MADTDQAELLRVCVCINTPAAIMTITAVLSRASSYWMQCKAPAAGGEPEPPNGRPSPTHGAMATGGLCGDSDTKFCQSRRT
jgi:hypothetical protein